MGVVSNCSWNEAVIVRDLERLGLIDRFTFVMASADYGIRKPHPAFFQAAAGRIGLEPEQLWFVGDAIEYDVAGARGVGMTAIWYNILDRKPGAAQPDATVDGWPQFVSLLEAAVRDRRSG